MNLDSYVQSRLLQIHSFLLHNLILKATCLHYSVVMEQITEFIINYDQNYVSTPLLTTKLETLAPFWAISYTFAHHTSILAWEKFVILDQI